MGQESGSSTNQPTKQLAKTEHTYDARKHSQREEYSRGGARSDALCRRLGEIREKDDDDVDDAPANSGGAHRVQTGFDLKLSEVKYENFGSNGLGDIHR
ncbi:putative 7.4 kDa protein in Gp54-alt intergenic region [Frankliniella fusca]|uniref:7.4 kDa protein in Gp54-alt intergenic region n=1 Tax=Frankliniella fusca TaxID=407009 RepID=A0AAE1GV34_9NEOP|nr:putative 7.4 kDa protein in Gp54-alt intergenic region [Frankliniella fusca]